MEKTTLVRVNRIMFVLIFLMAAPATMIGDSVAIIASFMAAFNIFIYPGFFFYAANRERLRTAIADSEQTPTSPEQQRTKSEGTKEGGSSRTQSLNSIRDIMNFQQSPLVG